MATVKKISISLPPETAEMLRQSVASGEYGSTSEVIRDALRDWHANRNRESREISALRGLWNEGLASGDGSHPDIGSIKRAARTRLSKP